MKKKKKTQQEKRQNQKRTEPRENTGSLQRWYLTFHSAVTLETGHKIAQTHRCVLTYVLAQWHERKCTNSGKGRLRRGVQGSLTFQVEFMRQFGNVKSFGQAHRSKSRRVSSQRTVKELSPHYVTLWVWLTPRLPFPFLSLLKHLCIPKLIYTVFARHFEFLNHLTYKSQLYRGG